MFESLFAPAFIGSRLLPSKLRPPRLLYHAHAYNATQLRVVLVFLCVKYVVLQQLLLVEVQSQSQWCYGRFVRVGFFREECSAICVTIVHSDYYRRGFVLLYTVNDTFHTPVAIVVRRAIVKATKCDGHDSELLVAPGLHVYIYYVLCKFFNVLC